MAICQISLCVFLMVAHGSRHWDDFGRALFLSLFPSLVHPETDVGTEGGHARFSVFMMTFFFFKFKSQQFIIFFMMSVNNVTSSGNLASQTDPVLFKNISILSHCFGYLLTFSLIFFCFFAITAQCLILVGSPIHPSTSEATLPFPYTHTRTHTHSQWSNPLH